MLPENPTLPETLERYPDHGLMVFEANKQTLNFLEKNPAESRIIAEVGVYEGHTSMGLAALLNGQGELHLYDFQDILSPVRRKLEIAGYENIKYYGNSRQLLDSYNWSLASVLERNPNPIYDYVYLDGSHTWNIDALTVLLVDKLLKIGGYLDMDDHDWTISTSKGLNPHNCSYSAASFTKEQMDTKQVKLICDLLLRRDSRYVEVVPNKIFQKIRS